MVNEPWRANHWETLGKQEGWKWRKVKEKETGILFGASSIEMNNL